MLRLEMLPAAHGDSLLVQWGDRHDVHRMLIDAGPLATYPAIHDRVKALGRKPDIELLVVTHIDGDHIEGVVRLLQDRAAMGLRLGDVWVNGWPQIAPKKGDVQGADQGEMVGALLTRDHLPWNQAFKFDAVAVRPDGPLPCIALPGGAQVTVLGPGPDELRKLRREWIKVMREVGVVPGQVDDALKRLATRKALAGVEDLLGGSTKLDNSVANGSSIALLFEYDGHSLLLTGDSHGDVLSAGLRRLCAERDVDRIPVDAFKLQHHGSRANVTDESLSLVQTTRYLVSSNGARYHHPDREAIMRILDGPSRDGDVELVFNYDAETTRRWGDRRTMKRLHYTATFPESAAAGAVLEV
jgi:hypothetical protein